MRAYGGLLFPGGDTKPQAIATAPRTREMLLPAPEDMACGYLIKGMLGRGSHAAMYGAPGEGKTFVALDMAHAIAQGRPWRDRKVTGGLVLYLAFEGGGGLKKRAAALKKQYGSAPRLKVIKNPAFNLRELAGRHALRDGLAKLPEKPVLIVIDTFARALMGADENSAADVGAFNTAVQALTASSGAAVLLVHHSGKDKTKGARGSSALLAALDTEIQIDGNTIISRKQRDDDLAPDIGFKLKPVAVGVDGDGETLFSCVVEAGTGSAQESRLSKQAAAAMKALAELSPNNAPVAAGDWFKAFERLAWDVEPPSAASRKRAFRRVVDELGGRVVRSADGETWTRRCE